MPNFNPFGNVTGKHSATLFEIRLDDHVVVLRGTPDEAASQRLSGTIVLCLPAPLKVEDVHLRMTGHLKVGWIESKITATGLATDRTSRTSEIFNHKWQPFVGAGSGSSKGGVTLPAGNHEWPFELIIPGSTPESVEGLHETSITYRLKATVARGKLAYDLHAYKPVRIIRTLDPSALEFAHAMTVENIWPNKVEYSMVIPQKAVLFGSVIEMKMRFTSLLKGLKFGTIRCALTENQEFTVPSPITPTGEKTHKHVREVMVWTFELSEDNYCDVLDDETGQDGYVLQPKLHLPKRLRDCMQDVDTHSIKIRHKVKFNIALHNPDGHVSELRATLPVTIFISPNIQMDDQGCLLSNGPQTSETDATAFAPPLYGQHILDQLYEDIDPTGYMTPHLSTSGINTPHYQHSRSGSTDNLAALVSPNTITPAALSSRLQDLHMNPPRSSLRRLPNGSGPNTPHPDEHRSHQNSGGHSRAEPGYFDQPVSPGGHSSTHSSNVLSRRTSEEDHLHLSGVTSGSHTPEHVDLADLNKVPSYTTALRTPARSLTYSAALPNYEAAISAPPSPGRENFPLATPADVRAMTGRHGGSTPHSPSRSIPGTPITALRGAV